MKKQHAFLMRLLPGNQDEYKTRHDNIWPKLESLMQESGISNYSIYLDEESDILFAYHESAEDFDQMILNRNPVMRKWWSYMADIMETNPDHSPKVTPLKQVFYFY